MSDSRFFVVAQPVVSPGVCFICKTDANGPFVDTGASDNWLGQFYICAACITEMAAVLEISQAPIQRIKDEAWKEGNIEGFKEAQNAFSNVLADLLARPIPGSPYASSVEEPDGVAEVEPDLSGGDGSDDGSSEQGDGATGVEGTDGLPGDSVDGLFDLAGIGA